MKKYLIIILLFFSFYAGAQKIVYTPMTAAGYQMKYLKTDSGFALPFRDTTIGRGVDRPGLMVINTQDSLPYYYNGKLWKPVYVDSTGVIHLIDAKVDSVTVNGNNIFYWVAGLGYGAQLNKLDSIHVSADSIFTCIAGNCTFQYTTSVGSGTVTSIMAGFGLTGDTITTTGTIAVDTSVFHTTNWNNAAYAPIVHFHSASDIISGTLPIARGGTGMSGIGGAGQVIRVASGGTTLEYYTPPDISGKVNYSDSTIKYVTPYQLGTKVDTSFRDTTVIKHEGAGIWTAYASDNDTLHVKNVQGTSDISVTTNTDSSITVGLKPTTVTPGSYTNANITVDANGRATAISNGSSGSGSVASVTGNPTGLVDNTDPANPVIQQDASKLDKSDSTIANRVTANTTAIAGKLSNITGLVTAGTNVTLSGSGTSGSPYVVSSSGGGSSSTIDQTLTATDGQTSFTFTSIPTRYILMFNNIPFTNYTVSGSTITVGFTDAVAGDKIRLYQTQ